MTDEFLTKGLRQDRYLKALRLIEQFEDEIEARLRTFDQQMTEQQPDLFSTDDRFNYKNNRSSGSGLAIHRINHWMQGPSAPNNGQRLNVHLYWMPPTEYNRTDITGALRTFGYKIKEADEKVDRAVAEDTRAGDWDIQTSGNPYDDNTVFYRHVSSAAEIEETMETLVDHFATFGSEFAAN